MGTGRSVWLGRLAMAGPIAFTLAWLIGGLVQDEYSFRQEDISALAAMDAQYAWVMITGFILLGLRTVALAAGLVSTLRYPSAVIGSVLIIIGSIGLVVAGLARNDCSSELPACAARVTAGEVSWHHQVHDNVSLILFLALIAARCSPARSDETIAGAHCGPTPSSPVCSALPCSSSTQSYLPVRGTGSRSVRSCRCCFCGSQWSVSGSPG